MSSSRSSRILGYVILHRHGHRAPEKNLFKNSIKEIELWSSLLPSSEYLLELSSCYPLEIDERNQKPQFDIKTKPFGCITEKGVHHLYSIGKEIKENFPLLKEVKDMKVYATNYQRTQVSREKEKEREREREREKDLLIAC